MSFDRVRTAWRRRIRTLLMLALLAGGASAPVRADSESPITRYQVEAAFLYHFAKYVTWPPRAFPAAVDPIVIGILGEDPFGQDLVQTLRREKPVQGRPLRVITGHTAAEVTGAHILFISGSETPRLKQHFDALQRANSAALTVGESDDFLAQGGAVRFVVEKNKVRFEIATQAAERAGIVLSSKLLSLARNTRERG